MKATIGRTTTWIKLIVVIAIVALAGLGLKHLTYAATGSLTFNPTSGGHNVGDTFNVVVQENSGTDPANTVDAVVTYPASLQFVSDTTVAPFNFNPGADTPSGGSVHITRAQLGTSSTGAQTVTTITFKVLSAGSANVSFGSGSDILSAINSSNLLVSSPSATYTLSTPVTPPPTPTPTPTPAPTPTPVKATTPVTSNPKSTSVSVAPKSSGGSTSGSSAGGVTVPNNGSVAVATPVSVEPATIQSDGVTKVQYYLAGKLVDTETKPPYKYNIDTTKLKNGTYKLVSKTYYDNGTSKQATQNLVVKDSAVHTANLTWLYILVVVVVVLVGLGVNFIGPTGGPLGRLFRRSSSGPGPSDPTMGNWPTGSDTPSQDSTSGGVFAPAVTSSGPAVAQAPAAPKFGTSINQLSPPDRPIPGTTVAPDTDKAGNH